MKTTAARTIRCFFLGILLVAAPALSAESAANTLKVQVRTPPSWNLPGERFPEFFAASLSDVLNRQGLSLPVAELRSVEDPQKAPLLLKIEVTEWRMTDAGDISCTFTASLKTPQGERRLGQYADTRWVPGVLLGNSSRAYYPMQLEGVQALCRDLAKAELFSPSAA